MMDDDDIGLLFDEDDDFGDGVVAPTRLVLAVPGKAPSEMHRRPGMMVWGTTSDFLHRYEFAELKHPDCANARRIMFIEEDDDISQSAEEFRKMMQRQKLPTEAEMEAWQAEIGGNVARFCAYYASTGWDPEQIAVFVGMTHGLAQKKIIKPEFEIE